MGKSRKSIWMAIVNHTNTVVFAKGCASKQKAEMAIVEYLQKNEEFEGNDFGEACSWIGEKDLRFDLMVFEMEARDFNDVNFQAGLFIDPPPNQSSFCKNKKDTFTKTTIGFVVQNFEKNTCDKFVCTGQEFIAGDQVDYEDAEGNSINPPVHEYQQFNMTLINSSQIINRLKDVLAGIDVGGEQSRQFAHEIKILDALLRDLGCTRQE